PTHILSIELKGSFRKQEITFARKGGMFLKRKHTDLSLEKIGEVFGGKDHTTVIYSCDKIAQLQKNDLNLGQTLRQLSDRINFSSRH
ncbi:MAG: chromosomal replication initiator protein DnaA, partial [Okeania sp. SIO4D6]|nr:chromosomal replication initiator protein DnaA [Okeania sp. SIO4D6]